MHIHWSVMIWWNIMLNGYLSTKDVQMHIVSNLFSLNRLCMILHDDAIKMETFSALLAFCAGNSSVTDEFPAQRPVTRSFDVFLDLRLNQQLGKQRIRRWFETPLRSLWRHCNELSLYLSRILSSKYEYLSLKNRPKTGLSKPHIALWTS